MADLFNLVNAVCVGILFAGFLLLVACPLVASSKEIIKLWTQKEHATALAAAGVTVIVLAFVVKLASLLLLLGSM